MIKAFYISFALVLVDENVLENNFVKWFLLIGFLFIVNYFFDLYEENNNNFIPKRKMEKLYDMLILVISSFFFLINIVMLEKYLLETQIMNLYLYIVFTICGLVTLIVCPWIIIHNKLIVIKKSFIVKGLVVDYKNNRPVIVYRDPLNCKLKRFIPNLYYFSRKKLGKEIEILVYKRKDGRFRREEYDPSSLWFDPFFYLVIGIIMIILISINVF
jgi:hypothetical protein